MSGFCGWFGETGDSASRVDALGARPPGCPITAPARAPGCTETGADWPIADATANRRGTPPMASGSPSMVIRAGPTPDFVTSPRNMAKARRSPVPFAAGAPIC